MYYIPTILESKGKEIGGGGGALFQGRHLFDIMALIWGGCLLEHGCVFNATCILNMYD